MLAKQSAFSCTPDFGPCDNVGETVCQAKRKRPVCLRLSCSGSWWEPAWRQDDLDFSSIKVPGQHEAKVKVVQTSGKAAEGMKLAGGAKLGGLCCLHCPRGTSSVRIPQALALPLGALLR